MNKLKNKPFIVIDLGSGRYVQTKKGHEYYNLLENPVDGRFYGYCPPYDNVDINSLGAGKGDSAVDDVIVIYTTKVKNTNNRIIVAFTDSATVHRNCIVDEHLERTINQDGKIIHCSYSVESDHLYNLESYPKKFIIEIRQYNPYMFRRQRFYKGKYRALDEAIIRYMENYIDDVNYIEDEIYQTEIQDFETKGKERLKNTFDLQPKWSETGDGIAVKKNVAYAKQAIIDSDFHCVANSNHQTFMTKKGVPYMEGHHLIPCTVTNAKLYWNRFGKNIDCVENIVSLCPTCHRKIHFGSEEEKKAIIRNLYKKQEDKLKYAGLNIIEHELIELYLS